MRPPYYLYEPGDLSVYRSLEDALMNPEPDHIKEGYWSDEAFDRDGLRLRLYVNEKDHVCLEAIEEIPTGKVQLREYFLHMFNYAYDSKPRLFDGARTDFEDMSHEELVDLSLIFVWR